MSRSARSILDDDELPVDLSEDNDAVDGVKTPVPGRSPPSTPTPAAWKTHREVLKSEFPDGWNPPRKLSREAMEGLRQLHRLNPEVFTTPALADKFRISPEAVRRILKSSWAPPKERRMKLLKKEAVAKEAYFSLSGLRERIETRKVKELRREMKQTRVEQRDNEEYSKNARSAYD
ncbi:hypothetical protein C8J57DRAFT_1370816 [Mycena rebaudengoi]|nr:hypothetical protein C8J57DRAFT_1370816 [Mycena rebaudengoi]